MSPESERALSAKARKSQKNHIRASTYDLTRNKESSLSPSKHRVWTENLAGMQKEHLTALACTFAAEVSSHTHTPKIGFSYCSTAKRRNSRKRYLTVRFSVLHPPRVGLPGSVVNKVLRLSPIFGEALAYGFIFPSPCWRYC